MAHRERAHRRRPGPHTGDLGLAEDIAQEALVDALVAWPSAAYPPIPAGVLTPPGGGRSTRSGGGRPSTSGTPAIAHQPRRGAGGAEDLAGTRTAIPDDVLALIFIACHPVLSREAQVARTLRVLGGLTSDEIARAFPVPSATVQAHTRAKKTLAAAQVPFEVPPPDECRRTAGAVLGVST